MFFRGVKESLVKENWETQLDGSHMARRNSGIRVGLILTHLHAFPTSLCLGYQFLIQIYLTTSMTSGMLGERRWVIFRFTKQISTFMKNHQHVESTGKKNLQLGQPWVSNSEQPFHGQDSRMCVDVTWGRKWRKNNRPGSDLLVVIEML